jgi:DNA polymerase III alpha subunit
MTPYTVLLDRILRWDGKSIVDPDQVEDLILSGLSPKSIITTELTEDIELFNMMSDDKIELYEEKELEFNREWLIPDRYKNLDLVEYFSTYLTSENEQRIVEELEMVQEMQVENEIRCIIYVIDVFKVNGVVWGVGRGSSCASYLLFLIGVHCVDPIKYNIPMTEFFH